MKSIFEPRDFDIKSINVLGVTVDTRYVGVAMAEQANAKLSSLGISAETPEELKRFQKQVSDLTAMWAEACADYTKVRERLAELERMHNELLRSIAEALHRARLVQIEPLKKGDK